MTKRFFLVLFTLSIPVFTTSCLNPDFVNSSIGGLYPAAPGDEPFLLVRVINDTTATLDIPIAFEDGTGSPPFTILDLTPEGREVGILLDWPVTRLGIGNLDNPFFPAVVASVPDQNGETTNIGVAPNQVALRAGTDYYRGDAVVFRFVNNGSNPTSIIMSTSRIDGTTEQGPFSREDTFRTVRQILQGTQAFTNSTTTTTP